MPPSSPAWRSSLAHAVTRWSAASTSAGGNSRPARPALPESSAHRSTRARLAMCSRRFFALPGATCMTARVIAARSWAGVSDPARSAAQITPSSSSSDAPAHRSSSPPASSTNNPSTAHPGATSSGSPLANPAAGLATPAAGLAYSPGKPWAEPGIPGPRRPAATAPIAASVAVRSSRAAASAAPA